MKNYTCVNVQKDARIELHDQLGLTGAEVSINTLPANVGVPFIHSHLHNEEIYGIISGNGKAVIDGEDVLLSEGSWLRVSPNAKRQLFAGDSSMVYICIQVKENSLDSYTMTDAVI